MSIDGDPYKAMPLQRPIPNISLSETTTKFGVRCFQKSTKWCTPTEEGIKNESLERGVFPPKIIESFIHTFTVQVYTPSPTIEGMLHTNILMQHKKTLSFSTCINQIHGRSHKSQSAISNGMLWGVLKNKYFPRDLIFHVNYFQTKPSSSTSLTCSTMQQRPPLLQSLRQ